MTMKPDMMASFGILMVSLLGGVVSLTLFRRRDALPSEFSEAS